MRSFVQSLAHSAKKLLLQIVVAVMCVPLLPIEFGTRCIFFTDSQCIEYNQWIVSSCIVLQNAIQYIILVSSNSIWYQQKQQKQQKKSKKRNKRGTQEKVAFDCIAVNWNIWHAVCMCMCGCVYEWCYLSAFAIHCQHWLFVLDTRTQIFFSFFAFSYDFYAPRYVQFGNGLSLKFCTGSLCYALLWSTRLLAPSFRSHSRFTLSNTHLSSPKPMQQQSIWCFTARSLACSTRIHFN